MSAPLGPVALGLLILAGPALFAFAVVLGAGRRPPDPPWDGAGYAGEADRLPDGSCPQWCPCQQQPGPDAEFTAITKHIEE